MDTNRIREIHKGTAYPESRSVYQALLQVWNECEQEKQMNKGKIIDADKLIDRLDEIFNDEVSITYIKKLIDELSEDKVVTDNSKVNINLLKRVEELETDNAALCKALTELSLKLNLENYQQGKNTILAVGKFDDANGVFVEWLGVSRVVVRIDGKDYKQTFEEFVNNCK